MGKATVSFQLDEEDLKALDEEARARKKERSVLLREFVRQGISKHPNKAAVDRQHKELPSMPALPERITGYLAKPETQRRIAKTALERLKAATPEPGREQLVESVKADLEPLGYGGCYATWIVNNVWDELLNGKA